jgi:type I restriction enzyme S subunit
MSAEWPVVQLSECATFQEGYVNPSQKNAEYFNGPVKWLRAVDLNDGVVVDTSRTLSEAGFKSAGKSALLFEPGTLAISKSGTIGRLGILEDFMCGNRAVINIRVNHDRCNKYFIFYVLKSRRTEIESLATGSVQKNLYTSVLGSLEFKLPPRETQDAVAKTLWSLDSKIQLNHQINQTLEQMAQAIFKSWFVDFEPVKAKIAALDAGGTEEDALLAAMQAISGKDADQLARMQAEQPEQYAELRATAELFPSAMQPSELGEIPEGWEVAPFAELARLDTSSVKPGNSPEKLWEHYSIPAFDNGKSPALELGADIKSNKYKVHPAAVLSSKLNPHFPRTWWPDVTDEMAAICSTEFMQFVPKNPEHRPFVAGMVTSTPFQSGIRSCVSGTTGSRQRAQPKQVAVMEVVLPTAELVMKFSQLAGPLYQMQARNIKQSQSLARLRDTLLPKLLSGELTLPDTEEPQTECQDAAHG